MEAKLAALGAEIERIGTSPQPRFGRRASDHDPESR
jgi:hypothetical protein